MDILNNNVQTYVEKLIEKEFSSNNNEEKDLSDNRQFNPGEHRKGQSRADNSLTQKKG